MSGNGMFKFLPQVRWHPIKLIIIPSHFSPPMALADLSHSFVVGFAQKFLLQLLENTNFPFTHSHVSQLYLFLIK
jgi:hypothetical protein